MSVTHHLVLVPHRDARLPLRTWSAGLFPAGIEGAWSFPWAAPLAQVERPFTAEELKHLAGLLRRHINAGGGTLTAGTPGLTVFGEQAFVWGPVLNIELSGAFFEAVHEAITRLYSPVILGSALIQGPVPEGISLPPPVSFRAAALANMSWRPLVSPQGAHDGYSFEWEIDALHWLPKK